MFKFGKNLRRYMLRGGVAVLNTKNITHTIPMVKSILLTYQYSFILLYPLSISFIIIRFCIKNTFCYRHAATPPHNI